MTGFALNVVGLAVGLAACLHMLWLTHYESNHDSWISGGETLYRLEVGLDHQDAPPFDSALSMPAAGPLLAEAFPEVRRATRLSQRRTQKLQIGETEIDIRVAEADPNFFELFPLLFESGGDTPPLDRPDSVVLTRSAVQSLFGERSAVGETISFPDGKLGVVTAVLDDLPPDSHLALSVVRSTRSREDFAGGVEDMHISMSAYTYLDIEPGTDIVELQSRISSFFAELTGMGRLFGGAGIRMRLVRLTDIHLKSLGAGQMKPPGDETMVHSFLLVAFLILIVTTVNSANLNMANFQSRGREVAIRKSVGASQMDIGIQFLLESSLQATLSLLLALPAAWLLIAIQGRFDGIGTDVFSVLEGDILVQAIGLLLVVVVASGGYPALRMARMKPASLFGSPGSTDKGRIRTLLVASQFWIASFLVISTLVIHTQTKLSTSFDRGFSASDRLVLRGIGRESSERPEAFRDAALRLAGVRSASLVSPTPPIDAALLSSGPVHLVGRDTTVMQAGIVTVDGGLAQTLDIELLAGSWLSENPSSGQDGVVVDFDTMRALGIANPDAALGQMLVMPADPGEKAIAGIVGVVDNIRWGSARESSGPHVYSRGQTPAVALVLDVETGTTDSTLAQLRLLWESFFPGEVFRWSSLEQDYAALSQDDRRRALVFLLFSLLAIALSCTGLYGMTLFFLQRQRREISLRRLFGAGSWQIALLLLRRHTLAVIAGFLLAVPIAWQYGNSWLEQFNPRIDIGLGVISIAAGLLFGLSAATVFGLVLKAARQRPDTGLRTE